MAEFARIKWAEYRADLEARGLWNVTRANTLDRMVRMMTEYEFYYPMALAEGPVKLSADGGQYVNMLWSNCQKLNEGISKLEKALLLTPESMGEKAPAKPKGQAASPADKYLARQAAH
jgi:hypothetical protein